VDKGMALVAALRESWKLTMNWKKTIFFSWVLTAFLFVLGAAAWIFGRLAAGSIWQISVAFIYLRLSGQPTELPEYADVTSQT
jgi:hypothetical protein